MSQTRAYLDWNASAPLRPEARAAMLSAMDEVGNPSSVHAEGRKAKAIVQRARAQVADLVGCEPGEVVFTSGATEAVNLFLNSGWDGVVFSEAEHDCVKKACEAYVSSAYLAPLNSRGRLGIWADSSSGPRVRDGKPPRTYIVEELVKGERRVFCSFVASGETGVFERPHLRGEGPAPEGFGIHGDCTQAIGKVALFESCAEDAFDAISLSSHKLGGPKGAGALALLTRGASVRPLLHGGGQEQGRRAGTENVIGIAGFGAAAEAAKRDLEAGVWEGVEAIRNRLEDRLASAAPDLLIFGKDAPRLPNTSCFAVPGWKGETQVMQMDLAGFAVSAGSACSSGKVEKASRVLLAMGFDEVTASSAIRVSIGPTTTEAEVMAFADAWEAAYRRWRNKAA